MFCPVCKGEFREGFTRCDSCNVNLVEDLNNLSEKIEGEFLLCPQCQQEFHNNEEYCPECGLKPIRAILNKDDEYVYLEEPTFVQVKNDMSLSNQWSHYCEINPAEAVTVLESMDGGMLKNVMDLLDNNCINFMFVEPSESASNLGSIFGCNNPLERQFPKVVVRKEDEEKALSLVANSSELGLFEVPEELMGSDEDEEYDDEDDDY